MSYKIKDNSYTKDKSSPVVGFMVGVTEGLDVGTIRI